MKDHHVAVMVTGEARKTQDARELVRVGLLAMGAQEPVKVWGNAEYAQGVLPAKDQRIS